MPESDKQETTRDITDRVIDSLTDAVLLMKDQRIGDLEAAVATLQRQVASLQEQAIATPHMR